MVPNTKIANYANKLTCESIDSLHQGQNLKLAFILLLFSKLTMSRIKHSLEVGFLENELVSFKRFFAEGRERYLEDFDIDLVELLEVINATNWNSYDINIWSRRIMQGFEFFKQ